MSRKAWDAMRVFVSSTFHDMHAERDHLVRFAFPRLRERLRQHQVRLIDVDLRWGVSSGQDVTTVCYETIDRCRPWFVALLGERYGWIPPGTAKSITELEIDYAAFARDRQTRALFYFRDARALDLVPASMSALYSGANIPASDVNRARLPDADPSRQLAALKTRIREAGFVPKTYSATWNRDFECLADLHEFGRQVEEDLWAEISSDPRLSANFAADQHLEVDIGYDDFFDSAALDPWFGRRQQLRVQLAEFAGSGGGAFVVRGAAGSGKTMTLLSFCRDFHANGRFFSYFAGRGPGPANVVGLLSKLLEFLDPGKGTPKDCGVLAARVRHRLWEAANELGVFIVVDGIDQIDAVEGVRATDWLPDNWPARLRVLVSTRDDGPVLGLPRDAADFTLPNVEPDEAGQLLHALFAEYGKEISEPHIGALLQKEDSSSPMYLWLVAEELRVAGRFEALGNLIAELPGSVEPLLLWTLRRSSTETGFRDARGRVIAAELVRTVASLLAASRGGLSHRELQELVEPETGAGNVMALMRSVRSWFIDRGELVWFRHPRIERAVREHYLTAPATTHAHLAQYFHGRLQHVSSVDHRRRALAELPFHLLHAGRCEELWAFARSVSNPEEQRSAEPGARGTGSQTLLFALDAASRASAPREMAEFIIRTGEHLVGDRMQSTLDALRSGLLDSSVPLPEADGDGSMIWPLLFASELFCQNRVEEAQGVLRKLRSVELPRLSENEKWVAVALLADAWRLDPGTARVLTSRLIDDGPRVQLAIDLEAGRHYSGAAEVCRYIELTHTRLNAFQSLGEGLLRDGQKEHAQRTFEAVAAALEDSTFTIAPEYTVISASATALAGRPDAAINALDQCRPQLNALQRAWVVIRAAWAYGRAGTIQTARSHFDQIGTLADDVRQIQTGDTRIISSWIWLLVGEWSRDSMGDAYAGDAIRRAWLALGDAPAMIAAREHEQDQSTPGESNLEYMERVVTEIAVESARSGDVVDLVELEAAIERLRPQCALTAWLTLGGCHMERGALSRADRYWLKALAAARGRPTAEQRSVDLAAVGNHALSRFGDERGWEVLRQARTEAAAVLIELDRRRDVYAPLAVAYARVASSQAKNQGNPMVWRDRSLQFLARATPSSSVIEQIVAIMLGSGDFQSADRALELIAEPDRARSAARIADRLSLQGGDDAIRHLIDTGLLTGTSALETAEFYKTLESGELDSARELLDRSPSLSQSALSVRTWIRALCKWGRREEAMDVFHKYNPDLPEVIGGSFERAARANALLERALCLAEMGSAAEAEQAFESSRQEIGLAHDGWSVFRMMAGLSSTEVSRLEYGESDSHAAQELVRAAPFFSAMARGGARERASELLRAKQTELTGIRGSVPRSGAAAVLAQTAAEIGAFELMISLTDQISDRRAEHLEEVADAACVLRDRIDRQEWLEKALGPLLNRAAPRLDAGIRLCGHLAELFPDRAADISVALERLVTPQAH